MPLMCSVNKQVQQYINGYVLDMVNGNSDGQPFIDSMSDLSQSENDAIVLKHDLNEIVTVDTWIALLKKTAEASKRK